MAPISVARRDITVKIVVPTSGSLLICNNRAAAHPRTRRLVDALLLLGAFRLAGELLLHSGRLVDEAEADPFHHRLVLDGAGGTAQFLGGQSGGHFLLRQVAHLLEIRGRPGSIVFTG